MYIVYAGFVQQKVKKYTKMVKNVEKRSKKTKPEYGLRRRPTASWTVLTCSWDTVDLLEVAFGHQATICRLRQVVVAACWTSRREERSGAGHQGADPVVGFFGKSKKSSIFKVLCLPRELHEIDLSEPADRRLMTKRNL